MNSLWRLLLLSAVSLTAVSALGSQRDAKPGRMLHLTAFEPNQVSLAEALAPAGDSIPAGILADSRLNPMVSAAARLARRSPAVTGVAPNVPGFGGTSADEPGCSVDPASPAIGADIPATYFGPAPSSTNPFLVGPHQLLTSGALDELEGVITLPLYRGEMRGSRTPVWYILTDTTDEGNAEALGLNFAAKLNYAATGYGVRSAFLERDGLLVFDRGRVDFSPERVVVPGEDRPFPPVQAQPGSEGDRFYTPLVRIENAGGHIYNAPVIAFGVEAEEIDFPIGTTPDYSIVHDDVVAINLEDETVTFRLVAGFSFGRPVLYLNTESSDFATAALESATFAPGLRDIEVGNDDSAFSAVERIFVARNGQIGCENPQRQGLDAALVNGRAPLNVLGGIPTLATDYSPLWDVNLFEWTQESIDAGYRSRLIDEFQILGFAEGGFVTGPDGGEFGSVGIIVNCPIVFRFL